MFVERARAADPAFSASASELEDIQTIARQLDGLPLSIELVAARAPALVRVLPDAFAFPLETWTTMHEDLRASPRCRAAFDALAEGLAAYIAGA